ncbi:hypothetical protein Tco_1222386 [Tanacetum coccineum]
MFASVEHVLMALIEVEGCDEHWGSIVRIVVEGMVQDQTVRLEPVSPRLFCSGIKVYLLPPASSVREDAYSTKACSGSSMQYCVLWGPLQITHEDIVAEFCSPFRWKELSKEKSSKILPYGDGSCWKTFKLVASLIAKGKLK